MYQAKLFEYVVVINYWLGNSLMVAEELEIYSLYRNENVTRATYMKVRDLNISVKRRKFFFDFSWRAVHTLKRFARCKCVFVYVNIRSTILVAIINVFSFKVREVYQQEQFLQ